MSAIEADTSLTSAIEPQPCRLCGKLPEISEAGAQFLVEHAERDKPACLLGNALFDTFSEHAAPAVALWNEAMGA
jgi:hypothetical protein